VGAVNELNAIISRPCGQQRRFALCGADDDPTIRRSFDCHRATAVLRICAGVDDQFVAGLQNISQSFELFLISIGCRWLALVHPSHCRVYREKEQKTKAGESDGAGNVH